MGFSSSKSCDAVYLPVCLSNFEGSTLSCDFPSLADLRRLEFSVCLAFYLLLGQSDDFQAPYIPD